MLSGPLVVKQVIVVGDTQQLPPSDFFKTHIGGPDDEDDDDEETPESILEASSATGIPLKRLKWHYRSRHEELIAFSNREFYESQLITFPSVNADALLIEFVHVEDGIYDRGGSRTNTIEARRVAGLVIEHARSSPDSVTWSDRVLRGTDDGCQTGSRDRETR